MMSWTFFFLDVKQPLLPKAYPLITWKWQNGDILTPIILFSYISRNNFIRLLSDVIYVRWAGKMLDF